MKVGHFPNTIGFRVLRWIDGALTLLSWRLDRQFQGRRLSRLVWRLEQVVWRLIKRRYWRSA